MNTSPLFLGIDFGTSGCRAVAIDAAAEVVARAECPLPEPLQRGAAGREQDPRLWWEALLSVLADIARQVPAGSIGALSIDGTSGTLLVIDATGRPLDAALLYHDARSRHEADEISRIAPPDCAAAGPTSALAKLLYWQRQSIARDIRHALHQADWMTARLTGRFGISDENNALKLGYDAVRRMWPPWFAELGVRTELLPAVVSPGTIIGVVNDPEVLKLGYVGDLKVVAGTTDGVAAFIATGAARIGDAVTSLGSTLVVKLLSDRPIYSAADGVYSHRLGDTWLAGGASNSGGAVLLRYFSIARMEALTPQLDPDRPTGLDYYPLAAPGERFPINDPALAPRLSPRPPDDATFFQAMLEGMARIEALGYQRLQELGAPRPIRVLTAGGGARNAAWTRIRRRTLGLPVERPQHDEACYGAALIARGAIVS